MKNSSFERVVGKLPENEKERIIKKTEENFQNQEFDGLRGREKEKTPEQIKIISLANDLTNEIRRNYGLEDFDIPAKNIHVVKKEAWKEEGTLKNSSAFYHGEKQAIAIRDEPINIVFLSKVFHELIHFKAYNALQYTIAKNPQILPYRSGFVVNERRNGREIFNNFNEAITEELTKKFTKKLFFNPLFSKELEQTRKTISRHPNTVDDQGNFLMRGEDMFFAKEDKKTLGEIIGNFFKKIFGKEIVTTIRIREFTYAKERKNLNILIDKLFEKNGNQFKSREEIFDIFAKGMMTGNILPVGKLIEKTFGNGTFRKIGELDFDIEGQRKFIESL